MTTSLVQAQSSNGTWTLEDCVEYALANNEQIKIAEAGEDIAQAQIGQIRAQGLPQINGGIAYTNNLALQQQIVSDFLSPAVGGVLLGLGNITPEQFAFIQAQADTTFFGLAFGTKHSAYASVGINQLLFDGTYFVGLQAARTFQELSTMETDRTREQIVEGVSKAYYGVLVNEERLQLLERNVLRLDSLVYQTTKLWEEGFAERIDVSRLRVNRNNLYTEFQKLKEIVKLGYDILKFQMGMPITEPLALDASLAGIALESDMDTEEVDYMRRTDYVINQVNQQLVELDLRNVRAGYLPSLRASANLGMNQGAERIIANDDGPGIIGTEWLSFANVGLTLSIPIFDGLLKYSQAQEKQLQAEQLRQQQRLLENSIQLEVKQARVNYDNALNSLEWHRENMELAEEVIDMTQAKNAEGVGSSQDLVDANTALKEAQTNYYAAVYDLLIAQVELKKALGLLNY